MVIVAPTHALQQRFPFARHYTVSSATSVDREHGSGDYLSYVLEQKQGPQSFFLSCSNFLHLWPHTAGTVRYGEASHPGPSGDSLLTVGVSNPSGLRQKEDILLGLGPGIWALSETQLSQQTLKTSSGILRRAAQKLNRQVRFHSGAPAPLRQGSNWAGKWTGVATISDVPSMTLEVPWPLEHWNSG